MPKEVAVFLNQLFEKYELRKDEVRDVRDHKKNEEPESDNDNQGIDL